MSDDAGVFEYRVTQVAVAVRIDDDALIWNPDTEQLHRLNASATLVWDALEGWTTERAVSDRVCGSGQLDAVHIRQCVEKLHGLGVLDRRTTESTQSKSDPSAPASS